MEKGQGVKCAGREAWEGGGDKESQGFPSPGPALSSQGQRAGPASRSERGDARRPGFRARGTQHSTGLLQAAQDSAGCAGPVPTTTARSPSHLHLPGLAAAMIAPTSPASATEKRGGRRREDDRVTSRRSFAALAWVSRWTPTSAGWTYHSLQVRVSLLNAWKGVSARSFTARTSQADDVSICASAASWGL